MILAVDAGNSAVTLGCVEGRDILYLARLETSPGRSADEYAVLMERVLALRGVKLREFEGAAIASVVPPLTEILREAVKLVTGHDALVVGAGVKTGLNIGIDDPSQMGADLVAGAVAALDAHEPPVIIIDMGTATKITAVDEQSTVQGVSIMPGVFISLDALVNGTSLLKGIATNAPVRAIGKNTVESMQSGVVFGAASMLDGMVERFEAELGPAKTLVATGGAAGIVVPHCRHSVQYVPTLILDGLYAVYCRTHAAL